MGILLLLLLLLLFIIVVESCTISIIWDSLYTNGIPNELISPPNSEFCDFHLNWLIVLNVTTFGRYENLWQVQNLKEFQNCDPSNAIEPRFFTGVHEFSLSPGIFSFNSIYYFFSTSNGSLPSAMKKEIVSNCTLKLAFKLKPSTNNCTLRRECLKSSLSIQTTTVSTTNTTTTTITNGYSTLIQPNSTNSTNISQFILTDIQVLIFVLTGGVIIFVLGICLVLMLFFLFFREKRGIEEVSTEIALDPDFETYFQRFLTLEKEFSNTHQPEREFQSLPNLQLNPVRSLELNSLPNLLVRDYVYAIGLSDSSGISENSIHKHKSTTLV